MTHRNSRQFLLIAAVVGIGAAVAGGCGEHNKAENFGNPPTEDLDMTSCINTPTTGTVGQNEMFECTAENNGTGDATGVVVTEKLPGTTITSVTCNPGTSSYSSDMATCTVGGPLCSKCNVKMSAIATATAGGQQTYTGVVTITGPDPTPGNNSLSVTVQVNSPPAITLNPTNQTVNAGSTATFTAAATGTPTPTVQWQVSADGGGTWTNISGATSTTLTINAAAAAQNGNQVRAVFTNPVSTATTTAATLTVNNPAPTITGVNPTLVNDARDTTATVTGTGFVPGVTTFTVGGASRSATVVNSTTATLTVTAGDKASAASVTIVATNAAPGGGSAQFSVPVVEPLSVSVGGPITLPDGCVGTFYNNRLFYVTGGTFGTGYKFTVTQGTPPPGLQAMDEGLSAFNGHSINLKGTPTTAGTFNFTLEVSDNSNPPQTDKIQITVTIKNCGLTTCTNATVAGNVYAGQLKGHVTPPIPPGAPPEPAAGLLQFHVNPDLTGSYLAHIGLPTGVQFLKSGSFTPLTITSGCDVSLGLQGFGDYQVVFKSDGSGGAGINTNDLTGSSAAYTLEFSKQTGAFARPSGGIHVAADGLFDSPPTLTGALDVISSGTVNSTGALSPPALADINFVGRTFPVNLSMQFLTPDTNGFSFVSGTVGAVLALPPPPFQPTTQFNFALLQRTPTTWWTVETDANQLSAGTITSVTTPPPTAPNGTFVLKFRGSTTGGTQLSTVALARLTFIPGPPCTASGEIIQNDPAGVIQVPASTTATCTPDLTNPGRFTLNLTTTAIGLNNFHCFMLTASDFDCVEQGQTVSTQPAASEASSVTATLQTGGPFTDLSTAGDHVLSSVVNLAVRPDQSVVAFAHVNLQGGAITGTGYVNTGAGASPVPVSGTYTIDNPTTGLIHLTLNGLTGLPTSYVGYVETPPPATPGTLTLTVIATDLAGTQFNTTLTLPVK